MAKQEKSVDVRIPEMKREYLKIAVKGTSPLIVHKFSDKAKKQILDKQTKKANKGREAKDFIADFVHSLHLMNGVKQDALIAKLHKAKVQIGDDVSKHFKNIPLGFPASGFKNAAVASCRNVDGIPMTLARGAFFVKEDAAGCVEIKYDKLLVREDMVRLNGKSADVRFRGCFENWSTTLNVESNPLALGKEQICNLIDISGFATGIGDWRPERNGAYGMFELKR
jgi:hypothetical protein